MQNLGPKYTRVIGGYDEQSIINGTTSDSVAHPLYWCKPCGQNIHGLLEDMINIINGTTSDSVAHPLYWCQTRGQNIQGLLEDMINKVLLMVQLLMNKISLMVQLLIKSK